jgi:hypothetical protein
VFHFGIVGIAILSVVLLALVVPSQIEIDDPIAHRLDLSQCGHHNPAWTLATPGAIRFKANARSKCSVSAPRGMVRNSNRSFAKMLMFISNRLNQSAA